MQSSRKLPVRGNFDVWFWHNLDLFGGTGFQALEMGSLTLEKNGEKIVISGLSCEYPDAMRNVVTKIPKNVFSVFAYHYSDFAEGMGDLNVDLYLSGHTHGGEIRPAGLRRDYYALKIRQEI